MTADDRLKLYYRFLIDKGGERRYGKSDWKTPERVARIERELDVIETAKFSATFIMLADVMDFCRREGIPYGPGRGSVGGCYTAYLAGIHDVDSLEWGLLFERFLNPDRVSLPDVDIDVSQRHRQKVLAYIVEKYNRDDQIVMQIGAFARAGGRAVVDLMLSATASTDPNAGATATNLKKCFPETGSIVGGQKTQRELHAWLYEDKGHGDKSRFIEIAEQAGWLQTMLKLDGMFTHLSKHAAGVVILRNEDMPNLPTVEVTNSEGERTTLTAYDMYSLDDLGFLKWDFLGLRTLDVVVDANGFDGGKGDLVEGNMAEMLDDWKHHRDDPGPYQILQEADTLGVFQMETSGYRRVLRDMQPTKFDHIVQLVALYRPGAIDFKRESDGKNMVEVFVLRHHGKEAATYDHPVLRPILEETHGIILYQEQQMAIVRELAGFTLAEADMLRKAIGKKRPEEMAKLLPLWESGTQKRIDDPNDPLTEAVRDRIWKNIEAAARYSWNKSHAVEYAIITWWSIWKKFKRSGFYAAEINSWNKVKERQANVIAEARQHVAFRPPDVNVAEDRFIVEDAEVVFGLNGIKGMGNSYRNQILVDRIINGPFVSYEEFCNRLESLPITMKLALVRCGAFDGIDSRERLLARIPKSDKPKYLVTLSCGCTNKKPKEPTPEALYEITCKKQDHSGNGVSVEPLYEEWTVAEHLNHNRKLKNSRPLPNFMDFTLPTDTEMATGEMESMGYYISKVPMAGIDKALKRHGAGVIGGEIERVKEHVDKNGGVYGRMTLITPALTKQNVIIFASNWPMVDHKCTKGAQLIFRGREDGGQFLAEAAWTPDDMRHHKKIQLIRGKEKTSQPFDGSLETVQALEGAGYTVKLL